MGNPLLQPHPGPLLFSILHLWGFACLRAHPASSEAENILDSHRTPCFPWQQSAPSSSPTPGAKSHCLHFCPGGCAPWRGGASRSRSARVTSRVKGGEPTRPCEMGSYQFGSPWSSLQRVQAPIFPLPRPLALCPVMVEWLPKQRLERENERRKMEN